MGSTVQCNVAKGAGFQCPKKPEMLSLMVTINSDETTPKTGSF